MKWAARRRLVIGLIIAAVGLLLLAVLAYALLYRAPSCEDGKQNQDEEGIDCGGGCAYVCNADASAPTTLFSTLIKAKNDRTDLVAAVENRNGELGAKNVTFTITLYSRSGTVVEEFQGELDLPPSSIVPIYIPGVAHAGETAVDRAFLTIDASAPRWRPYPVDPRNLPFVEVEPLGGTATAPRVTATLTNSSLIPMSRIPVIAFIRDTSTGNVVAASQTVVPYVAPQASEKALFTWSEPFAASSVRVEILPVVDLP